jgi:hypothetical protein
MMTPTTIAACHHLAAVAVCTGRFLLTGDGSPATVVGVDKIKKETPMP